MAYHCLIDTNLLVYPHDGGDPTKAGRAAQVLRRLGSTNRAALPAQVLAEFSRVLLQRLAPPIQPADVLQQLEHLMKSFPVLPLTPYVVLEAVRGVRDHGFSYFDAQIWAQAHLAQIPVVLSEDFQEGATHEGVTFRDPLGAGFEIESL